MDIVILDDVVSIAYQDYLEQLLLDNPELPWFLIRNLNEVKANQDNFSVPGLSIQAISDGRDHGMLAMVFRSLAFNLAEKLNISIKEIINARTFLQLPGGNLNEIVPREYHVDYAKSHMVLLYYVNESDGDTVILKQRYPFSYNKISGLVSGDVIHKITPKKGRVVLFNGSHFHSSSIPSMKPRCVINLDVNLSGPAN